MKKNKFIVILIAGIFSLVSCENTIKFTGEIAEPQMVMHSFISPDSVVKVHLSKSVFFLDKNKDFELIDNAEVYVWKNGNVAEQLRSIGNGYYTGNFKPAVDDIIKITASKSPFSASSSVKVEDAVPIISADTINYRYNEYIVDYPEYSTNDDPYIIGYSTRESVDITVRFKDPQEEQNYYRIMFSVRNWYEDGTYMDEVLYPYSDNIVFGSSNSDFLESGEYCGYYEFNDDLFNGNEYKIKFSVNSYLFYLDTSRMSVDDLPDYYITPFPYPESRELIVNLQSLSKSYYLLMSSRSKSESMGDMDFMGMFYEPIQIYSNVEGGIGVLGSHTNSIYRIKLRNLGDGSSHEEIYW